MADLREVERMARRILAKHGQADVPFAFDRGKRRLGATHWYGGDLLGWTPKLTLSKAFSLAAPLEMVEQTVKHEVAHILTGNPHFGHGPEWKAQCKVTGYKGTRQVSLPVAVLNAMYDPEVQRANH